MKEDAAIAALAKTRERLIDKLEIIEAAMVKMRDALQSMERESLAVGRKMVAIESTIALLRGEDSTPELLSDLLVKALATDSKTLKQIQVEVMPFGYSRTAIRNGLRGVQFAKDDNGLYILRDNLYAIRQLAEQTPQV